MDSTDKLSKLPSPSSQNPTASAENQRETESTPIVAACEEKAEINPTCSQNPLSEATTTSALIPQYAVQQGTSVAHGVVTHTGNSYSDANVHMMTSSK